jgi:hypothetical protein
MSIVRSVRNGRDNDPNFFTRMKPTGVWPELFRARFRTAIKRCAIPQTRFELDASGFRRPTPDGQLSLL